MESKETKNGLNLPAIKRQGGDLAVNKAKGIQTIDLTKKSAVGTILKDQASIQKDILNREHGLDLVLVGDLTISMTEYHELLKNKFITLCGELFPLIKNLRIGLVFYLDHDPSGTYGPDNPYITRVHKLTSNVQELIQFIRATSTGNGYDNDEAVEDALNDLNVNMNWRESSARSVVIFGDASPHPKNECPFNLDFFDITNELYKKGLTINSVYCDKIDDVKLQRLENVAVGDFKKRITYMQPANFFSWIANVTGGMVLSVQQIDDLVDIIIAAAAKDSGNLDELEKKMKATSPKKLNLIEVAKNAEKRRQLYQNGLKAIGDK
jgi:hypothetical protein